MPRNQYHPTPEERDEPVKLDLEPDEAIRLIMETGEHGETAEIPEATEEQPTQG